MKILELSYILIEVDVAAMQASISYILIELDVAARQAYIQLIQVMQVMQDDTNIQDNQDN